MVPVGEPLGTSGSPAFGPGTPYLNSRTSPPASCGGCDDRGLVGGSVWLQFGNSIGHVSPTKTSPFVMIQFGFLAVDPLLVNQVNPTSLDAARDAAAYCGCLISSLPVVAWSRFLIRVLGLSPSTRPSRNPSSSRRSKR